KKKTERVCYFLFFEKPYYLQPEKGGARAYALLRDALHKEGKAAMGTFVYHDSEWVCLIKPYKNALVMNRLRFAEEIKGDKTGLDLFTHAIGVKMNKLLSMFDRTSSSGSGGDDKDTKQRK
ncbi:Ku protein, partial [archaeon]